MARPIVLGIEGVDGTGKSCTVERLAGAEDYTFVKTPAAPYRQIRIRYDAPGVPTIDRFRFYAAGVAASVGEIFLHKQQGRSVIVDRYTLSLEHYHSSMDPSRDYKSLLNEYSFPELDFTVVLYAAPEIIKERILSRDDVPDKNIERNFDLLFRVQERILRASAGYALQIDTGNNGTNSDNSIDDVVDIICAHAGLQPQARR